MCVGSTWRVGRWFYVWDYEVLESFWGAGEGGKGRGVCGWMVLMLMLVWMDG